MQPAGRQPSYNPGDSCALARSRAEDGVVGTGHQSAGAGKNREVVELGAPPSLNPRLRHALNMMITERGPRTLGQQLVTHGGVS